MKKIFSLLAFAFTVISATSCAKTAGNNSYGGNPYDGSSIMGFHIISNDGVTALIYDESYHQTIRLNIARQGKSGNIESLMYQCPIMAQSTKETDWDYDYSTGEWSLKANSWIWATPEDKAIKLLIVSMDASGFVSLEDITAYPASYFNETTYLARFHGPNRFLELNWPPSRTTVNQNYISNQVRYLL